MTVSREDLIKMDGVVAESLSSSQFSVRLLDGRIVTAKLSGRLRRFHIRVLVGDRVTLGVSPYDLSHGLILTREKLGGGGPPRR
jgi:translation initiation factor IF-1